MLSICGIERSFHASRSFLPARPRAVRGAERMNAAAFRVQWPEATVESEVHAALWSDEAAWSLEIELQVSENDETRWRRRWERRFPRRLA